ncbi:F-box/LRR-repeat protein At1g67190-like [Juglans microcarpa x Juglans regia]|uniref:F-box/LRR-repeat protein At1g67190-like n=1 Tax=Juglans microcarpa x Juglans regia TaxID=2249226 RepID=UPI001B7E8A37|nr:F-box/LRR-repeat protein At1g67190-like [Juglans microcarpa x Juglans regia]
MEHLPVEVVGNILSRLGAARDVVMASATCSKWREVYCKHLQTFSFNSSDWPVYRDLPSQVLEILITQTIFQTTGLEALYILLDAKFLASTVISWLMYTRKKLRRLFCNVQTTPSVKILEIFGWHKLETLALAHNSISGVFKRFPCLKSLSLRFVSISALDLSLLLIVCSKIETLELIDLEIAMSDEDEELTVELINPTLKTLYVEAISLDKLILQVDSIERLNLKFCAFEDFKIVRKGTLKQLKTDDVSLFHLDTVETVDIRKFSIRWPKLYKMILRSSKLRRFQLWDMVVFKEDEIVDLETIAVSFPQLTHLSLYYDFSVGVVHYGLQERSSQLVNLTFLELGWTVINDFFPGWVEVMLKRCTNLKKLVIHGVIPEVKTHKECQMLADFTSAIVELIRKYIHLEVKFYFE